MIGLPSLRAISESFWFPDLSQLVRPRASVVEAVARRVDRGVYELTIRSDEFLYGAHVHAKGFIPDDNYFSVMYW